jgi:putative Mn2+ efflux pump MntP
LALKLILDLFKKKENFKTSPAALSFLSIILQAISVSIDAFMVGVSCINNLKVNIFYASFIIGVVTLILVFFALVLGKGLKKFLGEYAEFLGIFILLLLGTKNLMALLI